MPNKLESTANLIVLDLIAEGEIAGLVDQNGELVSGRNRPGRQGYVDSSGLLQGAYDKEKGPILDETQSSTNPFRYKGIFLNDTPVMTTPKGPGSLGREQVNFRRFYSEIRFGHQEQTPLNLLGSQNTISKGERLIGPLASSFSNQDQLSESSNSVFHTVTNINVTEVIVTINVAQLFKVESVHEETLGDMKDSEIEFFIEYGIEGEPLRNYRGDHVPSEYSLGKSPVKIKGIATNPYFVDFVIRLGDLDYDSGVANKKIKGLANPYKKNRVIKITRATREKDPEEEASEGDDTADHTRQINWQAVVEVVPENFNYGNSVIAASQFDARYFDRIPERSFNCKLMKIPVPSNYDPDKRRYKGHWDGTFSTEKYLWKNGQKGKYWTNNPAWIFYDLMTNRRYGVGKFLDPDFDPAAQVDKWNLYEISKICDEIVLSGSDPRYGWSAFETFKNKLKPGSNNYIQLQIKDPSTSGELEKKFGNSNAGGSPNLLDYVGQEIVIKTCEGNLYKRKIVSSNYSKSPIVGNRSESRVTGTGIIDDRLRGSGSTVRSLRGVLRNTGEQGFGATSPIGAEERHWLSWGTVSPGDTLRGNYSVYSHLFSNQLGADGRAAKTFGSNISWGGNTRMSIKEGDLELSGSAPSSRIFTLDEQYGGSQWVKRTGNPGVGKGAIVISKKWAGHGGALGAFIGPHRNDAGVGVQIYQLEFYLTGYQKSTVDAGLWIRVDNNAVISTNGLNVKKTGGWSSEYLYKINPSNLREGYNFIAIAVENYDNGNRQPMGLYARWTGKSGNGEPTAKADSYHTGHGPTGQEESNWAFYTSADSDVVERNKAICYRQYGSNGLTLGPSFIGPKLKDRLINSTSNSQFPANLNYHFYKTIYHPGTGFGDVDSKLSFILDTKNLRAGDKVDVYSVPVGGSTINASPVTIMTGGNAVSKRISLSAEQLGLKTTKCTEGRPQNLVVRISLGSPMTSDTAHMGNGAYNLVAPMLRISDFTTSSEEVLGWNEVSNVTIDGGLLENEFENEEVCGEAAVKFSGDYEVAEPRFACNVIIQDKTEAVNILNELASVFRGMLYYANGMTFLTTDVKRDPVTLFTNANAKQGNFSYSGSSKTSRKSVVLVRYNDVMDGYRPKIEYVEDADAIRKFGYLEDEVIAYGCTSKGQARRLGEWVLLTNQLEREAINFTAGLEASFLKPGDIFKVIDKNRTIKRYGGRIKDIETDGESVAEITLDSKIQDKLSHKKLTVITPRKNENVDSLNSLASSRSGGASEGVSIEEIANSHEAQITTFEFDPTSDLSEIVEINKDKVRLSPTAKVTRMTMGEAQHGRFPDWNNSADYMVGMKVKHKGMYWLCKKDHKSSIPTEGAHWERYQSYEMHNVLLEIPVGSIWMLESEDENISVESHLYRTLKISEKAIGEFEVNGLEYVPNKFDVIEKGAQLERVKPLPAYSYYGSLPNASLGIEIDSK